MLDVCLLGTSGMMPLPRRALTSLMTRFNGSSLLIDCGEGTQVSIREKGWSVNPIDTICFTHYHGDHVSGIPGLLLSMGNADRKAPLTMIGPKGLAKVINSLRVIAPGLPFDINYIELYEPVERLEMKGYILEAFKVNHSVTCYGYNIIIPRGGKFSVERAKALGIPVNLWNPLQKGNVVEYEGEIYTSDMVLGEPRKGIKVTYCTDTRPVPLISEMAKNADLFVCEGMYGEKEKEEKAKQNRHMTIYEAADIGRAANVKEQWLTHYSPSFVRVDQYMDEVTKIFDRVVPGKDRKSITLDFEEE
ncbi:MAG: ribonuclease Z [Lachnospiraceae bacterium]|nr:ribonuclease Z [Lachnoclostridium sp.]MDD7522339.1 ribonuclease Z [Lachnoclostridium sp.]MDY2599147.1 ribonuclease Z [Lachnospiraceae bacterium]